MKKDNTELIEQIRDILRNTVSVITKDEIFANAICDLIRQREANAFNRGYEQAMLDYGKLEGGAG